MTQQHVGGATPAIPRSMIESKKQPFDTADSLGAMFRIQFHYGGPPCAVNAQNPIGAHNHPHSESSGPSEEASNRESSRAG